MSRYLIRRIEDNPSIVVHPYTEIVALDGNNELECVTWRDNQTGQTEVHRISHVFLMTGSHSEHALAGRMRSTRRQRIREDWSEPHARGPDGGRLAAGAATLPAGNESPSRVCGW